MLLFFVLAFNLKGEIVDSWNQPARNQSELNCILPHLIGIPKDAVRFETRNLGLLSESCYTPPEQDPDLYYVNGCSY